MFAIFLLSLLYLVLVNTDAISVTDIVVMAVAIFSITCKKRYYYEKNFDNHKKKFSRLVTLSVLAIVLFDLLYDYFVINGFSDFTFDVLGSLIFERQFLNFFSVVFLVEILAHVLLYLTKKIVNRIEERKTEHYLI
jgi:hypothetical protein